MVSKDQAIGWIILIVCVIIIVGYPLALVLWPDLQMLLIAIPVAIAMILIFGIGAWIGWTMATTPPPKPIEEIEAELEEETKKEEEKSTTEEKKSEEEKEKPKKKEKSEEEE